MKPLTIKFQPVGVARDHTELQALLREIADTSGKSREQIDRDGGLPDRFASKALASVPLGTCQLGARTLGKMLKGVGAVLIVAKVTKPLNRAADSAVKRREEQVRARLLSKDVYVAARALFARENGKLGAKAYAAKVSPEQRRKNSRKGARIRWRNAQKQARADNALMEQIQIPPDPKDCQRLRYPASTLSPKAPNPHALPLK